MRGVSKILLIVLMAASLCSCFKKEMQGTLMRIAIHSQNRESDPIVKCQTEIESYAFWIKKGEEWEVASWEDALSRKITNKQRPAETRNEPDATGTFSNADEYQVGIELWAERAFIVVLDRTNKVYATRSYDTPINLPEVLTQLHLYAWKKSGSANGWSVINPFPDEVRDSLDPDADDTTEQEGEETTEE